MRLNNEDYKKVLEMHENSYRFPFLARIMLEGKCSRDVDEGEIRTCWREEGKEIRKAADVMRMLIREYHDSYNGNPAGIAEAIASLFEGRWAFSTSTVVAYMRRMKLGVRWKKTGRPYSAADINDKRRKKPDRKWAFEGSPDAIGDNRLENRINY